ncbi:MAG TPA: hypothetical protein VIY49_33635 [Bryobacteraceae bacterium]
MNSPKSNNRAEINRQNAARSSGPVTPEGRRRVSLNALRHGLTGHTVVLPSEDLAAYQKHCGQFHTELKPQGLIESKCVQTIADTYWRLDRIRAMENNLFGLAVYERTGEAVVRGSDERTGEAVVRGSDERTGEAVVRGSKEEAQETETEMSPDPLIHCALAQAKALEQHSDLLTRLSLYEHRLNRILEKAKTELKQLQKERVEAREKALIAAGEIANLKEALRQPWDPRDDGFEFSAEDLAAWLRRVELNNAALIFRIEGCLPAPPAQVKRK